MLVINKFKIIKIDSLIIMLQMLNNVIKIIIIFYLNNVNTENNVFKKKYVIKSHENDNDNDDDFKHVCIITIFLLIKLFYLLIFSLNYLFKFIQTFTMLTSLIDLIAVSSLIICCSSNSLLKSTFSHCQLEYII